MASSFWMRSQMVQGRYMYVECTQTRNVSENTSTIHWTLTVTGGSSSFYTTGPTQIVIGGNLVYYKERMSYTTGQFPAAKGSVSGTTTVKHDDITGEATIAVAISTMIYNGVVETRTENWVLDPNPRFATIKSATNFHDEENPTITYSNPAGNSAASLQACISLTGEKADIAYRDIPKDGTSYTFALTETERNVLRAATPKSNTTDVIFYVRSVIGDGTDHSTLRRTLTIKNPNPTISPTIKDSNAATVALTGDSSKLVRYYSNAAVTFGVAAVKKATLTSQKVICGNHSLVGDGTISGVETNSFVFTATDSRGNTTTKTVMPSFVEYVKVTCSLDNNMPGVDGTMEVRARGLYFNGSFGGKSNSLNVYYRYKAFGGTYSSWTGMTVSRSGNSYSATANITGLDYQTAYVLQAYAVDALATVYSSEKTVNATPVFDWGENDFKFNVPVNVGGQLTAAGVNLAEQEIYVGGDLNTYYPVYVHSSTTFAVPQYLFLKKNLYSTSPAWSGNHPDGTSSLAMGWMFRSNGWDGNGRYFNTLYKDEPYAKLVSHIDFLAGSAQGAVVWLRGGGATYRLASNIPITPTVYLTTTDIGYGSYPLIIEPKTTIDNGGVIHHNIPVNRDAVYPVGSIYICYSHTSPASVFGGTWTRIEDRFLWAVSASGSIGIKGGAQTHTLTVNELPSHNHDAIAYDNGTRVSLSMTGGTGYNLSWNSAGSGTVSDLMTSEAGGGAAHNNMPPYIQVSVWRRTA